MNLSRPIARAALTLSLLAAAAVLMLWRLLQRARPALSRIQLSI